MTHPINERESHANETFTVPRGRSVHRRVWPFHSENTFSPLPLGEGQGEGLSARNKSSKGVRCLSPSPQPSPKGRGSFELPRIESNELSQTSSIPAVIHWSVFGFAGICASCLFRWTLRRRRTTTSQR